MKLTFDQLLSNVAFEFNLRRYSKAGLGAGKGDKFSIKNMEAQRDQRINSELGAIHKKLKAGP